MSDLFFVALGLVIGSFLNVCISRLPEEKSVVSPGSHCPKCGKAVRPYDNIPLISYAILRGRCRYCREKISWQYPLVEVLTALTFWATIKVVGFDLKAVVLLIFFSAMIVLIFIDLNHRILPNIITLPGILAGLIFSLASPIRDETAEFLLSLAGFQFSSSVPVSFVNSLTGALVCGGFLWFVAAAYLRIRKIEGLGFGDIKLMGMVGAFLGMKLALLTIMLGSLMGAIVGFAYIKCAGKDNRYELPFGSFLGIAAIIAGLWGNQLIGDYARAVQGL